MRALAIVAAVLLAALVLLLGVASTQPDELRVERTAVIGAPAEVTYDLLDDFTSFGLWSPWDELDPHMQKTLEGAESGVGAVYSWSGNSEVGKGRMEIIEARPHEHIRQDLEFIEPFASRSDVTLALAPVAEGTRITWTMVSSSDLMAKLFGLFVDMDAMIGADFEKGLAKLDQVARAEAARIAAEAAAEAVASEAELGAAP